MQRGRAFSILIGIATKHIHNSVHANSSFVSGSTLQDNGHGNYFAETRRTLRVDCSAEHAYVPVGTVI